MTYDVLGSEDAGVQQIRDRRPIKMQVLATIAMFWILAAVSPVIDAGTGQTTAVTPPEQPASGFGGREYRFDRVDARHIGVEPTDAWLFTPDTGTDAPPGDLPVIVFVHGFTATDPAVFREWIDHLVRRGGIVIYPGYQSSNPLVDDPQTYFPNLLAGVRDALAAAPDIDADQVHLVGHSLGGILATTYSVIAPSQGLPPARTLTIIEPGGCGNCAGQPGIGVALPLNHAVPDDVLAHVVVGSDDNVVGDRDARVIWNLLGDVPAANRDFVTVVSDRYGTPPLVADHVMPQTAGRGSVANALDWYGLWRPLDALIACAEMGDGCGMALGDGSDRRWMGEWSDGTPVTPLQVSDEVR